jgi:glutamate racemase
VGENDNEWVIRTENLDRSDPLTIPNITQTSGKIPMQQKSELWACLAACLLYVSQTLGQNVGPVIGPAEGSGVGQTPGTGAARSPIDRLIAHAAPLQSSELSSELAWTFDRKVYQQDLRNLPIGIFDSGIGGLTVMEAILSLDAFNNDTLTAGADGRPDFSGESFVYLGDQANMPYGNYPAAGQEDYLRELILKDVIFLLGRRFWPSQIAARPEFSKPPVKAIVIGCNTASAYGLEDIKQAMQQWDLPVVVVGVVEAGARGVLETRPRGSLPDQTIAVLATVGTCQSGAYPRAIGQALGQAGRRVPTVVQQGFAQLAAAIEGDQQVLSQSTISEIIRADLRALLETHRRGEQPLPIDTIVLGCTHFPLIQEEILSTFRELRTFQEDGQRPYEGLIAESIQVVNPAELTAKDLFRSLARNRLRSQKAITETEKQPNSQYHFFISVPNPNLEGIPLGSDGGLDLNYKISRQPGNFQLEDTLVVPLSAVELPPSSLNLIRHRLPQVWNSLNQATDGGAENQ